MSRINILLPPLLLDSCKEHSFSINLDFGEQCSVAQETENQDEEIA